MELLEVTPKYLSWENVISACCVFISLTDIVSGWQCPPRPPPGLRNTHNGHNAELPGCQDHTLAPDWHSSPLPLHNYILNKTKYFRLRLYDEWVKRASRPETDLSLTWDWYMVPSEDTWHVSHGQETGHFYVQNLKKKLAWLIWRHICDPLW